MQPEFLVQASRPSALLPRVAGDRCPLPTQTGQCGLWTSPQPPSPPTAVTPGEQSSHLQGSQDNAVSLRTNPSVSPTRYKDGSLLCQAAEPGKYIIDGKYGVHTLEINR